MAVTNVPRTAESYTSTAAAASSSAVPPPPHPGRDADAAARAEQLDADARALRAERAALWRVVRAATAAGGDAADVWLADAIRRVAAEREARRAAAADVRAYALAAADAAAAAARKAAADEFEAGKRRLRERMLAVNGEQRRRVDAIRCSGVAKRRKRPFSSPPATPAPGTPGGDTGALACLEELLGLDEVWWKRTAEAACSAVASVWGSVRHPVLHAETYAQGDHVAVLSPKSASPKYIGWICSINSKEVQIRDVRDVAHRVYVSHLRNNRLFLRRTCDVL
ncbi:hypothetical protein I4F81_007206 [Pyropia yezoensis]|uniref:Uncharacterized protein n=1 Tax=Pyropia yezoensis TaxID=2788 RepID=A0ACC3C3C7_PYRYE|nr:hypothetical protein I4F81_007206 [Neopyropia yezoensis]